MKKYKRRNKIIDLFNLKCVRSFQYSTDRDIHFYL